MGRAKEFVRPYFWAARNAREGKLPIADLAWGTVRSFSQFGEDLALLRLFRGKTDGFYVDVGAFDPYQASNTCLLYRGGWSGINIEPDPRGYRRLKKARPRDINLRLAVGSEAGNAPFVRTGLTAGLDLPTRLWSPSSAKTPTPRSRITVEVQTLAAIFDTYLPAGKSIDLLDVDCEGHDLDVLHSNDWSRYRPRVLLVECHSARIEAIEALLLDLGYRLAERLPPTALFLDASGSP